MAVLTRPHEPAAPVSGDDSAGAALHLRRRGEQEVRTFPLVADKCTIGSSPRCHVCLPASEAQPLQCLLTLEAGAAMVTRWASGVLLNGREFTKTAIKSGDRLAIGEWEIGLNGFGAEPKGGAAVLAKPQAVEVREAKKQAEVLRAVVENSAGVAPNAPPVVAPVVRHSRDARALAFGDRVVLDLWTANRAARERGKALIDALRTTRREAELALGAAAKRQAELAAALATAQAESEAAKRAATATSSPVDAKRQAALEAAELECNSLRARLESHATAVEDLRTQLAKADAARLAAEDESLEQMQAAEAQTAELARLKAELEAERRRDAADRDETTAELKRVAAECEELAAECAQLTAQRDQLTGAQQALAAERDALIVECDGLRELLEVSAIPVASASDDVPASAAAEWKPPVIASEEAPESPRPVDASTIFAQPVIEQPTFKQPELEQPRVEQPIIEQPVAAAASIEPTPVSFIEKYRHLLEEDADDRPEVARRSPSLLDDEFLSPAKVQTCPAPDDDSDEALEAYMSSMMHRVRGTTATEAPAVEWAPSVEPVAAAEPEAPAPLEPAEFAPMKHATRKAPATSDLATLREIANVSARTAIADHHKRRHHESAVGKLLVAVAASSSSAYVMSSAPGIDTGWFWAGIFAGLVGAGSAIQVILTERRVRAEKRQAGGSAT